jgi:DNA-binding transcriptional ArsR family regulator
VATRSAERARPKVAPAGGQGARRPRGSGRPSIRDFTGGGSQAIEFEVRTAYDFIFSLSAEAGLTDDLPAEDRRWLADARAALPAEVREAAVRLFQTEWCIQVGELVVLHPEARTANELLEVIRAAQPAEVLRFAFGELVREADQEDLLDRALTGDREALRAFEALLPAQHREAWMAMLRKPAEAHRQLVAVLDAWAGPFSAIEPRVLAILQRDVDLRAGDRATLAGADLIEATTGGIRPLPEARIRRIILAPSYFSRPYNYLLAGDDWRFFAYPVADDALDADDRLAPPASVLRLHRALGDETRLRILKLLSKQDYYLTELAGLLDLSKPTIKHHLAQLRAAGLITAVEAGTVIYYTLRRPRLDDAATELKHFLGG